LGGGEVSGLGVEIGTGRGVHGSFYMSASCIDYVSRYRSKLWNTGYGVDSSTDALRTLVYFRENYNSGEFGLGISIDHGAEYKYSYL
jgi:hypothetical protein